jgi:integrase
MLGLLGLRIFEACGADISDLGEEHGHQMLRVTGNGAKVVLTPSHQLWAEPSTTPSEKGTAVPSFGPMLHTLADRARVRLPRMHRHMLRHTFVSRTRPSSRSSSWSACRLSSLSTAPPTTRTTASTRPRWAAARSRRRSASGCRWTPTGSSRAASSPTRTSQQRPRPKGSGALLHVALICRREPSS